MTDREYLKYYGEEPSADKALYYQWTMHGGMEIDLLFMIIHGVCNDLIHDMHLDHKVFEVTYPTSRLIKGENRYCLLEVKKRCCDEQGNETLERVLNVRLLTGYNLSEKAGRFYQPNCSPTLIVNVHAAFMDSNFRTYMYHQFDRLVYDYDITLNFSVESPEAWRYPTKGNIAKGQKCTYVQQNKYPCRPVTKGIKS